MGMQKPALENLVLVPSQLFQLKFLATGTYFNQCPQTHTHTRIVLPGKSSICSYVFAQLCVRKKAGLRVLPSHP